MAFDQSDFSTGGPWGLFWPGCCCEGLVTATCYQCEWPTDLIVTLSGFELFNDWAGNCEDCDSLNGVYTFEGPVETGFTSVVFGQRPACAWENVFGDRYAPGIWGWALYVWLVGTSDQRVSLAAQRNWCSPGEAIGLVVDFFSPSTGSQWCSSLDGYEGTGKNRATHWCTDTSGWNNHIGIKIEYP